MTAHLIASREALAKALPEVLPCCVSKKHAAEVADALLASDAVQTPAEFAAGLAEDEAACDALVMTMLDDGHTGFGDCRPVPASLDVTAANALRALAAALAERTDA